MFWQSLTGAERCELVALASIFVGLWFVVIGVCVAGAGFDWSFIVDLVRFAR
jgi:hypothetical protein